MFHPTGQFLSCHSKFYEVIIAKNIVIKAGVTNVDAWLIANNEATTGTIYTCDQVGNSSGVCDGKLLVNGPVVTDHLYLYRTAGSDSRPMACW